ncbi:MULTISPECIES: GntR family transcriptional regulator [Pseudothermotoga]|uniref:Regulatory protein GntR HTH n=1 Tax=Pseudothermotoga lettingae (strain ATCC BAA-301 / DSM 14385 / NBRC 107922 / TMO) TaxID=416591 RepID=A8F567_PSELT|nr:MULTISPECIES: GntR family transcriptional regulator [Pseudothermotoga]ABV33301.1 regulatory protein GntR HTH [Pseudothermotoga lettingae TMO]KUK21150.1 MAG: Regulatory protein GntR HTH [Pseudothermotoga lettingae]HBJ80494.1 GntR family transcriptional regulator [Pseudothermotoga sp.]HBT26620.1 GntR family transcriptional regulator [Pseudothermotoga sp.]
MLRKIDKHSGIPVYLQIVNQIKAEIFLGNLKAGDQIPPVRELEQVFDVNVNTVLKALDKLKMEGFLVSEHGVGYFVSKDVSISSEILHEVKKAVSILKNSGIDIYTSLLIIEEVWKSEDF